MSAQSATAGTPNGVGFRDESAPQGSEGATAAQPQQQSEFCPGPQQTRDVVPGEGAQSELHVSGSAVLPQAAETESTLAQAIPKGAVSTMSDVVGQSAQENSDAVQRPQRIQGGMVTPKATTGQRVMGQPSWLASMEVPKWVTRLGSIIQQSQGLSQAELAPSPLPGGSPPYATPPGGPTFRLRSPNRQHNRPLPIPSVPTPPSSSSIPAEAIQAEVQRQLQGVMVQLREYGEQNLRLREELEDTRAQLRREQQRTVEPEHTIFRRPGLLGELAEANLDPGVLSGFSTYASERYTQQPAPMPCFPKGPSDGVNLEYISRPQELRDGREPDPNECHGEEDALPEAPRAPQQAPLPKDQNEAGASGLIRSWWEGRPRSQTPPPQRAAERPDSPVLEALAKGVQQLQELQAQALSKATSAVTVEVVKPGTMTLMSLPSKVDGADAAITFQDWLEISATVMADISEASATWWQQIIQAVEMVYERWLAASPIERLGIEPLNTEPLVSGRWMRVNARAATMLLSAMAEDLKSDMVARRCTQNCVKMMFRVFTYYQPGGSAERTDVLRRLQNPKDFCGAETIDAALKAVRAWPRLLERCRAVQMDPPDASVLARGLLNLTDRYINESADASFRTSMLRTSLRLDARPTISQVVSYQKHLQAELEAMMTAKSASGKTPPKVQAVEPTLQPKARDAGGKTGINAELCKYFSRPGGCRRGEKCTYSHSMQGMDREQRAKKCLKCGSESHRQRECPVGKPRNKEFRLVANQLGIVIRRVQRDKRGMPHRLLPQLWRQYPLPQRCLQQIPMLFQEHLGP